MSDLYAYAPALGMGPPAELIRSYYQPDVASFADRCARAGAEWGIDKAAAVDVTQLFRTVDAHPLVLMLMVLDRYGPECLSWDPEVLRATLMRENVQVSAPNWTKILGVSVLLMSPSPWRQWQVFHWVARALAGLPPNFTYMEEPEIGHCFVVADVMAICDPERHTTTEVDKFVAAVLRHHGQVFAPESLAFATRELEDPQCECGHCGACFRDDNDVKCVTCTSTELRRVPYPFAALRDECRALWAPRRDLPLEQAVDGLPEVGAGAAVYEMLLQWAHAQTVRKQLLAQLHALAHK